jgi:hypothetical protein
MKKLSAVEWLGREDLTEPKIVRAYNSNPCDKIIAGDEMIVLGVATGLDVSCYTKHYLVKHTQSGDYFLVRKDSVRGVGE